MYTVKVTNKNGHTAVFSNNVSNATPAVARQAIRESGFTSGRVVFSGMIQASDGSWFEDFVAYRVSPSGKTTQV
jgi:hypothetical protein